MPIDTLVDAWECIGPVGFFPNATETAVIPPSSDIVLIGDASGKNDPSQGHGLSLVFRDVRHLSDLLCAGIAWHDVPNQFHEDKRRDFETLRQHAHWNERQATETGPEIDALKEQVAEARRLDPTAGGFAAIFATGPYGLDASEAARRHYLGEDLD
jgi:2-polyprenyl-6-methoxyphenol hydroxylase-like FAD-dependent oxidoreductase